MSHASCHKILLVLAHPVPGSLCHSLCQALVSVMKGVGKDITLLDLYKEGFQPVMDLEELRRKASVDDKVLHSQKLISQADSVVLVGPDWWGSYPGMMKGWLDRCLRPGVAYYHGEEAESGTTGLLDQQRWMLCMTSDGESSGTITAGSTGPDLFPGLDGLARSLFAGCGIKLLSCLVFAPVRSSSYRQRQEWTGFLPRQCSAAAAHTQVLPEGTWLWEHRKEAIKAETGCQEVSP